MSANQPSLWYKFWNEVISMLPGLLTGGMGLIVLLGFFFTMLSIDAEPQDCKEQILNSGDFAGNRVCSYPNAHLEETENPSIFKCVCPNPEPKPAE